MLNKFKKKKKIMWHASNRFFYHRNQRTAIIEIIWKISTQGRHVSSKDYDILCKLILQTDSG